VCCFPQAYRTVLHLVISLHRVVHGLSVKTVAQLPCMQPSAPYEALLNRMRPGLNMQDAGGGDAATACKRKAWWPCMKRTVVFGFVRAAKKVCSSSLIPCDPYAEGCIKQSSGRLHGSLDVDDGKDVCARTWGFGAGVAAGAAVGNAPGESDACRGVCDGAMAPGVGNRGVGVPLAYRHFENVAVESRAQPDGVRMRWLVGARLSWAPWSLSEMSGMWSERQWAKLP